MSLENEIAFFEKNRDAWAEQHLMEVALVKDETLVDIFGSADEAMAEGARRFGRGPYLVRTILLIPQEVTIPALTMGLLNADLSRSA